MEDKEGTESLEDLDQFDNLEKNFHKIVSELVTDQSLASFRVEYEKLHKSLVESHDDNIKLIEKCRQLNEDILANASKVSSVMTLSQKDQMTINGLKHEFEKAWSLVEISQEKEQKSKDVIENLKAEVSKLSRLVEQGSSLAFTQENSLHETELQIQDLKRDIANQGNQLNLMREEFNKIRESQTQLEITKKTLQIEFEKLSAEYSNEKNDESNVSLEVEKVHNDLNKCKQTINDWQAEIKENVNKIKHENENVDYLRDRLALTRSNLKVDQEDLRTMQGEVAMKKTLFEDEGKSSEKIQNDINKKNSAIYENDNDKEKYENELINIKNENYMLLESVVDHRKVLNEINDEKKEKRKRMSALQKEMIIRTNELNDLQLLISTQRREIEKIRKGQHILTTEHIEEKRETEIVESQNVLILNQAIDTKLEMHNLRGVVMQVQKDSEEYQIRQSAARSNHLQLIEEVKNRELVCNEKIIYLANLNEKIKHQESLTESIKNDRDLVHRLLQTANDENKNLSEETKELSITISELKSDIKERDETCLSTHIIQKNLAEKLLQLSKERDQIKEQLIEKEMGNTELRNHIQKNRYLLSQTDLQNMKQQQVINDLKSFKYSINELVTKRVVEVANLREEIYLLKGKMTVSSLAYKNKSEEIQNNKDELDHEVRKKHRLVNEVRHSKALWKEGIMLNKAVLLEQGRRKALEEELERPMNIHRWRFLEGTNPEHIQLIRMSMDLKDKLMLKLHQLQSKKEECKMIEEAKEKADKHIKFTYYGNINNDMTFLTETLHQKSEQLVTIKRSVNSQQGKIDEQKKIVLNMRQMLKVEKEEYYDTKKKSETIRASTAQEERILRENVIKAPVNRFVGGGFSIQRTPTAVEKARAIGARSALLSPNIIAPSRAKTSIRKKMPNGWNPHRQQLAPYLPTVTGPH